MNSKSITILVLGFTVLVVFGVSQLYQVQITPIISHAQTPSKYNFPECTGGISRDSEYCPRLDRIIEQNDQLINENAFLFCRGGGFAGFPDGYDWVQHNGIGDFHFEDCVKKVLENTK